MSGNHKTTSKETILKVLNMFIPIICVFLTYFLTNASAQATIVERLSVYFDFVDESMSYKQALQTVYEESKMKDTTIAELNDQIDKVNQQKAMEIGELNRTIESLQDQLSSTPNFEFKSPSLLFNVIKLVAEASGGRNKGEGI